MNVLGRTALSSLKRLEDILAAQQVSGPSVRSRHGTITRGCAHKGGIRQSLQESVEDFPHHKYYGCRGIFPCSL